MQKKNSKKILSFKKKSQKFTISAHNMKGWLIFYTFKFCILPYLIKYIYWISPLERHQKIEKKKILITCKNSLYREHYHLKRICKFAGNYSCKFHEPSLSSSIMVSLIFSFVFSGQSLPWIWHCTFWNVLDLPHFGR